MIAEETFKVLEERDVKLWYGPATIADVRHIVRLMGDVMDEIGEIVRHSLPLDKRSFHATLMNEIVNNPTFGAFVAYADGKIIGYILSSLTQNWFNMSQIIAVLRQWYVKPEHRKDGIAKNLFRLFEDWAKESNATSIQCSHFMSSPKGAGATFKRAGYIHYSSEYIKEI